MIETKSPVRRYSYAGNIQKKRLDIFGGIYTRYRRNRYDFTVRRVGPQGYLFSKPLTAAEVSDFILKNLKETQNNCLATKQ